MNEAVDKIKGRIRALTQKTVEQGASQAEAESAMLKVAELLHTYSLTMSEVEIREHEVVQKKYTWGDSVRYINPVLLAAIANFCDCKVWYDLEIKQLNTINKVSKVNRTKNVRNACYFFGFPQDVEMAIYLYEVIHNSIIAEIAKFKTTRTWLESTSRKSSTTAFQHGMNTRMTDRLYLIKLKENKKYSQNRSNALVTAKKSVVDAAYEDVMKQEGLIKVDLGNILEKTVIDDGSFQLGQTAANKVNVNRPIGKTSEILAIGKGS